jgi:hypothetical protein
VPASTTYWAWSGAQAATFDADTTQVASGAVATSAAPTAIKLTDNVAKYAAAGLVKYGTTVTMTAQVVDAAGKAVAEAGDEIWIQSAYTAAGTFEGITTYKLTTDANGKATLSFTHADPSSSTSTVDTEAWSVAFFDYPVTNLTSAATYTWDDAASAATTLVAGAYGLDYSTGNSLVAQATVYDQYGLGLGGETVTFTDSGSDFLTADRTTNSSGVAVQPITDTTDETDVVTATDAPLSDTVDLFFVADATTGPIAAATPIQSIDTAHSKIVAGGLVYTYDAGDFFYESGVATSFADFVDDLDTVVFTTLTGTYDTTGISTFDVG